MIIVLHECNYCRNATRQGITIVKNTGKLIKFCSGTCLKLWNVRHAKKISDLRFKKRNSQPKE